MARIIPQKKPKGFLVIAHGGTEVMVCKTMENAMLVAKVSEDRSDKPEHIFVTIKGLPDRYVFKVDGVIPDVIALADKTMIHRSGIALSGVANDYQFAPSTVLILHEALK
jgi:hypothetical protein